MTFIILYQFDAISSSSSSGLKIRYGTDYDSTREGYIFSSNVYATAYRINCDFYPVMIFFTPIYNSYVGSYCIRPQTKIKYVNVSDTNKVYVYNDNILWYDTYVEFDFILSRKSNDNWYYYPYAILGV